MSAEITPELFNRFLAVMTVMAAAVCCGLFLTTAGYGQYRTERWGKAIGNRAGWVIMELPVVVLFAAYWLLSKRTLETTPLVFFLLFNLHYCQRAFIFPLLIRGDDKMPWSVIIFGMIFNTANAFMQGTWIFFLSPDSLYTPEWLTTPQFVIGTAIFLTGFGINLHSDHVIRTLRRPGDTGFHVPRRGLFRFVTTANYFGEVVEWVGWAILTLSWAGLVFALWTAANLLPRAHTHHQWYIEQFGDEYPRDRKRLVPFVY
jgi:3-oxo-5-alpha-steroid 4-dehydrogenase 1